MEKGEEVTNETKLIDFSFRSDHSKGEIDAAFLVFLEHLLGGTYFEVRCLTDSLSTEESIVPSIFPTTKKKSKTIKRGV